MPTIDSNKSFSFINQGVGLAIFTGDDPIFINKNGIQGIGKDVSNGGTLSVRVDSPFAGSAIFEGTVSCSGDCTVSIPIDWENKTIGAGDNKADIGDYDAYGVKVDEMTQEFGYPDGTFPIFNGEFTPLPPKLEVGVGDGVPNEMCPGDFESFEITLSHKTFDYSPIGWSKTSGQDINATVEITNGMNGEVTTEEKSISSDFDESIFFNFDVPEDFTNSGGDIISINITSDAITNPNISFSLSSIVGNADSDFSITNIDMPSSGCSGDSIDINVDVENTGECNEDVFLEITNDVNSDVIQTEASTVFSGSSTTFFVDDTLPSSTTTYDIELVRGTPTS